MTTCKLADVIPEMLTDSVFSLEYHESCDALGTGDFLDRVLKPESGMIAQIQVQSNPLNGSSVLSIKL